MTKRQLSRIVFGVTTIYIFAFLTGLILKYIEFSMAIPYYYETFKDLTPFILAIPAAYLGYCFQQRNSYLESLRSLWTKLVNAINNAVQYTYEEAPTREKYGEILTSLSIVIDEVRGTYKNIGEKSGNIGLYPYEPIKNILRAVNDLGYGKLDSEKSALARAAIVGHWKSIRENFLAEFDRAEPTKVVSPYIEK